MERKTAAKDDQRLDSLQNDLSANVQHVSELAKVVEDLTKRTVSDISLLRSEVQGVNKALMWIVDREADAQAITEKVKALAVRLDSFVDDVIKVEKDLASHLYDHELGEAGLTRQPPVRLGQRLPPKPATVSRRPQATSLLDAVTAEIEDLYDKVEVGRPQATTQDGTWYVSITQRGIHHEGGYIKPSNTAQEALELFKRTFVRVLRPRDGLKLVWRQRPELHEECGLYFVSSRACLEDIVRPGSAG